MPEEYTTATGLKPTSAMRAALAYVDRCFPVFPCEPGGKRPLTQRGFLDATSDRSRAHAYWNAHPGANIGIPTGERSRLLVLDVDNFTSLEVLEAERGKLPETTTVKTGSGGIHVYFRYPAGETIRNSAGKLGPGLDVRGEGGYVIAPGSATTGPYEWLDRRPLADAPAWLLEAMREPSSDRSGAGEIGNAHRYRYRWIAHTGRPEECGADADRRSLEGPRPGAGGAGARATGYKHPFVLSTAGARRGRKDRRQHR